MKITFDNGESGGLGQLPVTEAASIDVDTIIGIERIESLLRQARGDLEASVGDVGGLPDEKQDMYFELKNAIQDFLDRLREEKDVIQENGGSLLDEEDVEDNLSYVLTNVKSFGDSNLQSGSIGRSDTLEQTHAREPNYGKSDTTPTEGFEQSPEETGAHESIESGYQFDLSTKEGTRNAAELVGVVAVALDRNVGIFSDKKRALNDILQAEATDLREELANREEQFDSTKPPLISFTLENNLREFFAKAQDLQFGFSQFFTRNEVQPNIPKDVTEKGPNLNLESAKVKEGKSEESKLGELLVIREKWKEAKREHEEAHLAYQNALKNDLAEERIFNRLRASIGIKPKLSSETEALRNDMFEKTAIYNRFAIEMAQHHFSIKTPSPKLERTAAVMNRYQRLLTRTTITNTFEAQLEEQEKAARKSELIKLPEGITNWYGALRDNNQWVRKTDVFVRRNKKSVRTGIKLTGAAVVGGITGGLAGGALLAARVLASSTAATASVAVVDKYIGEVIDETEAEANLRYKLEINEIEQILLAGNVEASELEGIYNTLTSIYDKVDKAQRNRILALLGVAMTAGLLTGMTFRGVTGAMELDVNTPDGAEDTDNSAPEEALAEKEPESVPLVETSHRADAEVPEYKLDISSWNGEDEANIAREATENPNDTTLTAADESAPAAVEATNDPQEAVVAVPEASADTSVVDARETDATEVSTKETSPDAYTAEKGDNYWDIMEGQTSAGDLEIMKHIATEDQQKFIGLLAQHLNGDDTLRADIGFGSDTGHLAEGNTVDVSELNKVATEFAKEQGLYQIQVESIDTPLPVEDSDAGPEATENPNDTTLTAADESTPAAVEATDDTQEAVVAVPEVSQHSYIAEKGDNYWDIMEGQTSAGSLEVMNHIAPDQQQAFIDELRDYLNSHDDLRSDIGFGDNMNQLSEAQNVDIGALNEAATNLAKEKGLFDITAIVDRDFSPAMISEYSKEYVGGSEQFERDFLVQWIAQHEDPDMSQAEVLASLNEATNTYNHFKGFTVGDFLSLVHGPDTNLVTYCKEHSLDIEEVRGWEETFTAWEKSVREGVMNYGVNDTFEQAAKVAYIANKEMSS